VEVYEVADSTLDSAGDFTGHEFSAVIAGMLSGFAKESDEDWSSCGRPEEEGDGKR
jgi:hypothetical protein